MNQNNGTPSEDPPPEILPAADYFAQELSAAELMEALLPENLEFSDADCVRGDWKPCESGEPRDFEHRMYIARCTGHTIHQITADKDLNPYRYDYTSVNSILNYWDEFFELRACRDAGTALKRASYAAEWVMHQAQAAFEASTKPSIETIVNGDGDRMTKTIPPKPNAKMLELVRDTASQLVEIAEKLSKVENAGRQTLQTLQSRGEPRHKFKQRVLSMIQAQLKSSSGGGEAAGAK